MGLPDDGKWSDHPAVIALRASDLALATAQNTHDWSAPALAATTNAWFIERRYKAQRSRARALEDPETADSLPATPSPGPQPRVILDVIEVSDIQHVVVGCSPTGWSSDILDDPDFDPQLSEPKVTYSRVDYVDGVALVDPAPFDIGIDQKDRLTLCTLERLRYAYFDPAPDLTATYTTDDVIPPEGSVDD